MAKIPEIRACTVCTRITISTTIDGEREMVTVNIPRALFSGRTGREPRYHVAIEELQDWAYTGKRLVPLKGYFDIVWERPKSRKRPPEVDHPELFNRRIRSARAQIVQ